MKRLMIAGLILLAGCGGSTPTQPATPTPIPAANLAGDGSSPQITLCAGAPFNTCTFQAAVKNSGPGCATNIRGVVKFFDQAGGQIGASLNWIAPAAVTTLRVNETFSYTVSPVQTATLNAAATFRTEAAWDNVRC